VFRLLGHMDSPQLRGGGVAFHYVQATVFHVQSSSMAADGTTRRLKQPVHEAHRIGVPQQDYCALHRAVLSSGCVLVSTGWLYQHA
jgi:hypothetical protein